MYAHFCVYLHTYVHPCGVLIIFVRGLESTNTYNIMWLMISDRRSRDNEKLSEARSTNFFSF